MRFDPTLSSMRDLVLLMLVAGVSAGFVALSYVAVAIFAGVLPIEDFAAATLRYWVGDMIGNHGGHTVLTHRHDAQSRVAHVS